MIGLEEEIKFLEDEIDRLEIEIMPLRFQQEGYRMLLEKRRQEKGLRQLWASCSVSDGSRVLVKLNGEEEALYEVVGVIYSTKYKTFHVKGIRLLKSGHRPKYFIHTDLGGIPWFATHHKRPCKN